MNKHALFALPPIPSIKAQGLNKGVAAAMYLTGSTAVRDFMQPLGATAYKAGVSARREIEQRIRDLRLREYASIVAPLSDRDSTVLAHPLPREWFLIRLPDPEADAEAKRLLGQLPGGSYDQGVIKFRIPPGVAIDALEKRFQKLLGARNLNSFLKSLDGRGRLTQVGLPADARLFTDYTDLGRRRRSLACEIFLVRPERELNVLLEALLMAIEGELKAKAK